MASWGLFGGSWGDLEVTLEMFKKVFGKNHGTRLVNGHPGAARGDLIDVFSGFLFFFFFSIFLQKIIKKMHAKK